MNSFGSAAFLAMLFPFLGCAVHSTRYVPPSDNRVYVAMVDSQLGVVKNGTRMRMQDEWSSFMNCSTQAREVAERSKDNSKTGQTMEEIGRALGVLGGLGVLPAVVVGIPFFAYGTKKSDEGMAGFVDAVNIHNGERACVQPPKRQVDEETTED